MPKIIKDIEANIFNAAIQLFGEYGYKQVDMKMISKKVGIAVGTLYNYYPNKKELFISVFEKSWQNTFSKIDVIIKEEISPKEKIRKVISILYDEMAERKGIGRELFKENIFDQENLEKILYVKEKFLDEMERLVNSVKKQEEFKLEDGMERRLAETILILTAQMRIQHPNEREKNIQFINQLIDCIYGK
ncbi:TetR/AcrR family transcriptional regulator [Caloranaerobacter azorensis]|uniref:TetR/AcrR family transcriptional regulator n=1 Tax=Caloranaerobacter azorensis TaxID=116090 RepID=UPI0005501EC8|nr:TetR/AcrR family transcriptional regulator [Caloranaerobacter azorensis]